MIYLGLDQSLTGFGVALVESGSDTPLALFSVKPGARRGGQRLVFIRDAVREALQSVKVHQAALEGYSYASHGRTFELGEVGGLVKVLLIDLKIPYFTAAPSQLKKFVTGDGAADKEKVRDWVTSKWNRDIADDDMADAYGFAKLAQAYATGVSSIRHELEVVKTLKTAANPGLKTKTPRGNSL